MSGGAARQAAEALREAAERLRDALHGGDEAAVAAAVEERAVAFEAVAQLDAAGVSDAERALIREAARLDAEAAELAQLHLAGIRHELDEIGRAREVARVLRGGPEEARFVSKRV